VWFAVSLRARGAALSRDAAQEEIDLSRVSCRHFPAAIHLLAGSGAAAIVNAAHPN